MRLGFQVPHTGVPLNTLISLAVSVAAVAVAYGAQAHSWGFPWWLAPLLGIGVLAASSELVFLGLIASGVSPFAALISGLTMNARTLAYSTALAPDAPSRHARWLFAHFVNDETFALAKTQRTSDGAQKAVWSLGIVIALVWPLGAALGGVLGTVFDPETLGLDAVFPAVLTVLLWPSLANRETRPIVVVALLISLAGTALGLQTLVPLIAAMAAFLPAKVRKKQ